MSKLLFLVLAFLALYILLKGYARRTGKAAEERPATSEPEKMVCCAHCGVYLPRSESIETGDHHFCSDEHYRLGAR